MKNNSSILTIGSFDGVHKGHQSLIKETVRKAKEKNAQSIIVTLERPMKNPHSLLTLLDEKILRIEAFLPDQIIIIPVPSEILTLAPSDFFNNFLIGKLNVAEIICGTDFAFGKNKQGNVSWLKKNAPKLGIKITVIKTLTLAAQKISSSNIRALLGLGDVEKANKLLGYNFDFSGIPFREKGLGKKLGFPTVNLKVDPSKLLPHGVFISLIKRGGEIYPSITNIGRRPTIDNVKKVVPEVHILNFDAAWGRQKTQVQLIKAIRPEHKFPSIAALKTQISKDKNTALHHFNQTTSG